MTNLQGKTIFITGGARGIGLSIAICCKRAGANVVVVSRTQFDLDRALVQLNQLEGSLSLALRCDVSDQKGLLDAFQRSFDRYGAIYGVIAAAAVSGPIGSFIENDFDDWKRAIDINLNGTALTVHVAYPFMKDPAGGRVILFSGGGQGPLENFSSYVTAKGAIWRFAETVGAELCDKNIFVNAIAPGAVNTFFLDDVLSAGPQKVGERIYQKSLEQKKNGGQSPEKAAELCLYLLSEESRGLWGKTLSAIWDPYRQIKNTAEVSQTDLFTYRRVVDQDGGTRAK